MSRLIAMLILLTATMLWGLAAVAQKSAMASMGPLTFIAARYLLGGLTTLPLALGEWRRAGYHLTPRDWGFMVFLSVNFFLGSYLQQAGIARTSVTNTGFLTGLYVMFVPLILFLVFRTRPHPVVWASAPLALAGLYLLTGARLDGFNTGDMLVILGAVFWAMHVLVLGHAARTTGLPVFVSCISFILGGAFGLVGALGLETVTPAGIGAGWAEIAYAGLVSTAIGFTLQAIGQVHVPPANAAIILSAESLFAALGGAVFLGERLPLPAYAGAALIFLAIVMVETIPALRRTPPERPVTAS